MAQFSWDWLTHQNRTLSYSTLVPLLHHHTSAIITDCNRCTMLSPRPDLPGFWTDNETKREVWLSMTGLGIVPVNKLVSLTWLLWALRSFRRFTLHQSNPKLVDKPPEVFAFGKGTTGGVDGIRWVHAPALPPDWNELQTFKKTHIPPIWKNWLQLKQSIEDSVRINYREGKNRMV